jgi:hypothetical protein
VCEDFERGACEITTPKKNPTPTKTHPRVSHGVVSSHGDFNRFFCGKSCLA